MKPIKKPARVKPKSSQIQKKLTSDLLSKWEYIIESEKSKEFVIPPETKWNKMLTLISPIAKVDSYGRFSPDGKMGSLTTYFIPIDQFSAVKACLEEFDIADEFHDDLIWVFLNMVFAASEASAETNFKHEVYTNHNSWINAFGILDSLADEKYSLKELALEYEAESNNSSKRGSADSIKSKIIRFKEKNVLELFIKMIQHYKTSDAYELAKISFDFVTEVGVHPPFEGYKNVAKKWQSYFSVVIYYYLAFQGNESKLGVIEGWINENLSDSNSKIGLSNRKIYLLIGKLMLLSGLISVKEKTIRNNSLDEALIDTVGKKIQPEIKSKKETKSYKNPLLNPGIISLQVPPFYLHFLQEEWS